jgi:hypothetical protein
MHEDQQGAPVFIHRDRESDHIVITMPADDDGITAETMAEVFMQLPADHEIMCARVLWFNPDEEVCHGCDHNTDGHVRPTLCFSLRASPMVALTAPDDASEVECW